MADPSQGTELTWGATAIGKLTNFSGPGLAHDTVDVSDLSDTAMAFVAAGISESGEVTIDINYEPDLTIHKTLIADINSGTTRTLTIAFNDAATTTYTAAGFCTGFEPTGSVGDKLSASVNFKLSGAVGGIT